MLKRVKVMDDHASLGKQTRGFDCKSESLVDLIDDGDLRTRAASRMRRWCSVEACHRHEAGLVCPMIASRVIVEAAAAALSPDQDEHDEPREQQEP